MVLVPTRSSGGLPEIGRCVLAFVKGSVRMDQYDWIAPCTSCFRGPASWSSWSSLGVWLGFALVGGSSGPGTPLPQAGQTVSDWLVVTGTLAAIYGTFTTFQECSLSHRVLLLVPALAQPRPTDEETEAWGDHVPRGSGIVIGTQT